MAKQHDSLLFNKARSDLKLELDGAKDLREGIAYMDSVRDYVSRDLLIEILADEEGHIDWIETELDPDSAPRVA